jgi:hypothetical protein
VIDDRDESFARQTRDEQREQRAHRDHRDERAGEQQGILDRVAAESQRVAQRSQHERAREQQEEVRPRPQERAHLAAFDGDDALEDPSESHDHGRIMTWRGLHALSASRKTL